MSEIFALTIGISVIGTLLLIFLFKFNVDLARTYKLKKFRSTAESFADLLNYSSLIEDGIMLNKNGSLTAAFVYETEDEASILDSQKEFISATINRSLIDLTGWMWQVDQITSPTQSYPDRVHSFFPDPVSLAIDEERRMLFNGLGSMYQNKLILTLTYFPPVLAERKLVELMFVDDTKNMQKIQDYSGQIVADFQRKLDTIQNDLSAALKMTQLKAIKYQHEDGSIYYKDDLLRWLNYAISGEDHPIILPDPPINLDNYLSQNFLGGVIPRIGRKYIGIVAIDQIISPSTMPGMLNELASLSCEYRWNTRFICIPEHEALAEYNKIRKKWKQKARGFIDQLLNRNTGRFNQDALDKAADADVAIAEITGKYVSAGYYTSVIVLMDEDRSVVEKMAIELRSKINNIGCKGRIEEINAIEAYLGSLPGHGYENIRRPLISSLNLADLMPTSSIWTGFDTAPCPQYPPSAPAIMECVTKGSVPLHFNVHVGDLGHFLMIGPTRAGKSTHLALLATQLRRYPKMKITCFDKGNSMYPMTKAVGGLHFDIGADAKPGKAPMQFSPLNYIDSKADRAWATDWIETILELNNVQVIPRITNEIANVIDAMANSPDSSRNMSEFVTMTQDEVIRAALRQYTIDGNYGNLFDAETDGLEFSDFTTFEIESLMELDERYLLPTLLYMFQRIYRSLDGSPAVILIDEAWIVLSHPVFAAKIKEFLKAFAKKNCSLGLSTQSLVDASESSIFHAIIDSTVTKIFLANPTATEEKNMELYLSMGLNKKQIFNLAKARPKREYYMTAMVNGKMECRLYELALGKLALSFVGATDLESLAQIKALVDTHGELKWVKYWLAEKNIDLNDYLPDQAIHENDTFTINEFIKDFGYETVIEEEKAVA